MHEVNVEMNISERSAQERRLDRILWGGILIWAGLVFMARSLGWLGWLHAQGWMPFGFFEMNTWALIALGAGAAMLVKIAIVLIQPDYKKSISGEIILAAVFIGMGLSTLLKWELTVPFILIAIGVAILFKRKSG